MSSQASAAIHTAFHATVFQCALGCFSRDTGTCLGAVRRCLFLRFLVPHTAGISKQPGCQPGFQPHRHVTKLGFVHFWCPILCTPPSIQCHSKNNLPNQPNYVFESDASHVAPRFNFSGRAAQHGVGRLEIFSRFSDHFPKHHLFHGP